MFDDGSFDSNSFSTSSWLMEIVQAWRGQIVQLQSLMRPVIELWSRML